MKHTLLFAALGILMLIGACKPGDENLNPTPQGLLSGYLLATRNLDADSPMTKYTDEAMAVFFKHPGDTGLRTLLDSVRLNGIKLNIDNPNLLYRLNPSGTLHTNDTCLWNVYSSSNNPSFDYNYNKGYPVYLASLPDTMADGIGVDLPFNMDSAVVIVSDGVNKAITSSKGTGVTVYNMGGLSKGQVGTLQVNAYRKTTQTFWGKNFLFVKQIVRAKPVWLR